METEATGESDKGPDCFRAHLEQLHEECFGWAMHCCSRNRPDAEDVLQSAYLKILSGKTHYRKRSNYKTWVFAIIRNTAADMRRRNLLNLFGLMKFRKSLLLNPPVDTVSEAINRSQVAALLIEVLGHLPSRQREVLHLVFYHHLSIREAAEVMGVSIGAARRHYERGKKGLRHQISKSEICNEYELGEICYKGTLSRTQTAG